MHDKAQDLYRNEWGDTMSKEAEYYLRVVKERDNSEAVEITKFQGKDEPADTYKVFKGGSGRWFCDCMAGANGRNCKHLEWAKEFIVAGKPVPYVIKINRKGERIQIS